MIKKNFPMPDLPKDDTIQRILIIKWSALGDVVIASTLFEDIYYAFPGREIHLNTLPPWDVLFLDDPRFSQVCTVNPREKTNRLAAMYNWLHHVRRMRYDLIIDLQSNDRSRVLLTLLQLSGGGPRYRVGNHPRFPYNIAPRGLPRLTHAFTRMRTALKAAGIPAHTPHPVLYVPTRNRERAEHLLKKHDLISRDYVILLPGCQAAGYLKRWGAKRFSALAQRLHAHGIDKIVLIGGREEWDECLQIQEACDPWLVNLCGHTEILDIVPLCEKARLIVANDTGTAHVASAAGRPMMVLCGPTDPRRVKPIGDQVIALQADLPCINCYRKHCSHHSCMAMLTAPLVFEHLRRSALLENPS